MKRITSKTIIMVLVFTTGAGLLFTFGMTYFLKEKLGIVAPGFTEIASNLPEELSFVKWIIIGAVVFGILIKVLVWGGVGWFLSKTFGKEWKDLGKKKNPLNPMDDISHENNTGDNPSDKTHIIN